MSPAEEKSEAEKFDEFEADMLQAMATVFGVPVDLLRPRDADEG